jgi:hypothetical protein
MSDQTKTKLCRKCNIAKSISEFSKHSGTKDKLDNRCKDCVKAVKTKIKETNNSNNGANNFIYLDKFETDIDNTDWQGGKIIGNVFRRTTQNINYYVSSINGKQKSFNIDKLGDKDAKKSAEKYILESNDRLNLTKNKYKIIKIEDKPKYIIVQLSKEYVMLTDYDKLDTIKKHNLFVSNGSNIKSKKYSRIQCGYDLIFYHNYITGNKMTDHINGYPLDNRMQNLRNTNPKENNNNRTCINDISFEKIKEFDTDMYKCIITHIEKGTLKKKILESSLFLNLKEAEKWARNMSYVVDKNNIDEKRIESAEDFIKIMEKYAKGFKYHDIFSYKSDKSESESEEIKPKKKNTDKIESESSIESSESEEEIKPKKKNTDKIESESSSELSESEEEIKPKKKTKTKSESSSESSESEEEIKPKKKHTAKSESSSESSSESEEEIKPKKKNTAKIESESSDESEEEIKPKKKNTSKIESESSSESEEESKPLHENLQNKVDIYKKYKKINPDYNIKQIELTGRAISHIIDDDKEYKYCSGCENWKLTDDFFKSKDTWDSLARSCKICKKKSSSISAKDWKERNKEKISEYNKKYREENKSENKQKDETKVKISKTLSEYFTSDAGKENVKKSHQKRSETMKKERDKIREEITDKKCGNCDETKTVDNFCKKAAAKDGYQTWCKSCVNLKKIEKRLEK